jgi:hypothetical protein
MIRKNFVLAIALLIGGLTVIQAQDGDNGITVPGTNLAEKLTWLQRSADSHNTYIVEVNADENIEPHTFEYKGAINITIVLRGNDVNKTIRLRSHGAMFTIRPDVTIILDNNISLHGHRGNTSALVFIDGGTLKMNAGSTITGNHVDASNTGGVYVASGTFEMVGGTISDNSTTYWWGGGVQVGEGVFEMIGGTIIGNTASYGGGVQVHRSNRKGGTFTMRGGTISGNTAREYGGGVYVNGDVGGSYGGTFSMIDGVIMGNTAYKMGGGVFIHNNHRNVPTTFTKTGGTITGYNTDPVNGNVVKDDVGVIARMGHAIYASSGNDDFLRRKETNSGPDANFSISKTGITGAWEN